jgi:hypothetical protein
VLIVLGISDDDAVLLRDAIAQEPDCLPDGVWAATDGSNLADVLQKQPVFWPAAN